MTKPVTNETPPRRRRALAAVPDPAPAVETPKPRAPRKSAATPRSAGSTPPPEADAPQTAPAKSSPPTLLSRYEGYVVATPPAKRKVANAELEKSLAGFREELRDTESLLEGAYFAFRLATIVEAVSQAYNVSGEGSPAPLRERYAALLAKPAKPTSRRAWNAYAAHADEGALRSIVHALAQTKADDALATGLGALQQAFGAQYAAVGKAE